MIPLILFQGAWCVLNMQTAMQHTGHSLSTIPCSLQEGQTCNLTVQELKSGGSIQDHLHHTLIREQPEPYI